MLGRTIHRCLVGILSVGVLGVVLSTPAAAQPYDLLLAGGHVIDPKNGIDAVMDVAIADGTIARVAAEIPATDAERVVDVRGLFVTPGLVDLHVHVFHGTDPGAAYSNGFSSIAVDGFTLRTGVTTVVDLGSSGWRNFPQFKAQVIDRSVTRVLAFLNIVGSGMSGDPIEQDVGDMDARLTAMQAQRFRDVIVGVKTAHFRGQDWHPVIQAVEAGELVGIPVAVDFGQQDPPLSLRELLLERLRPGDILTHAYAHVNGRVPIVGEDGQVRPFVREARARGVLFDVGHGGGSFVFSQAVPAMRQGFAPDSISTDLHRGSMNGGMKTMLNVMSKFLNMGMSVQDAVARSTWAPARFIKQPALGNLDVGAEADVAVIRLHEGEFGFLDTQGRRMSGTQKLESELTLRAGRVVWDLNGRAAGSDWDAAR